MRLIAAEDDSQYMSLKPLHSPGPNAIDHCDVNNHVIDPGKSESKGNSKRLRSESLDPSNSVERSDSIIDHPGQCRRLAERFPRFRYIFTGISLFFRFSGLVTIVNIIDGGKITGEGQMRVPTFFADQDGSDWMVEGPISAFAYFIAIMFGALHLAGWNFFFRSQVERDIWRIASIIVTSVGTAGFIATISDVTKKYYIKNSLFFSILNTFVTFFAALSISIYLPSRLILFVEALFLLKDLPAGALAVVQWTLFIPHV